MKGPYSYLNKLPGKDMRSKLMRAFNTVLDVPEDRLDTIGRIVGMLHTASLLYVLLLNCFSTPVVGYWVFGGFRLTE